MKFVTALVVFAAVVYVGINVAGHIALSQVLEAALSVPVKVSKVKFDLANSQAGIYGLKIQSPEGFEEETMASLPELSVSYDLAKIFEGKIRIPSIVLNLDEVTVERNGAGKINLLELDAMKSRGGAGPKAPGEGRPQEPKAPGAKQAPIQVTIDVVDLSIGRARYVDNSKAEPTVREFPVEVRNAKLENVTQPDELVGQVVVETMKKVGMNAILPDWNQFGAGFGTQASEAAQDVSESLGGLAGKLKSSLGVKAS
jgi:hypothetical protein